jgi:uncharacterized membrane protein
VAGCAAYERCSRRKEQQMIEAIIYLLAALAAFFWLVQVIDLLFRHPVYFESHTHKLMWFLVLVIGNIIGAVWYYMWKRESIKEHETEENAWRSIRAGKPSD